MAKRNSPDRTRTLPPITGRTANQKAFLNNLRAFDVSFGLGYPGTGKTYLATRFAIECLMSRRYDQIILTRPAVEAGEELGFLPGEVTDKFSPYVEPFLDVFHEALGEVETERLQKKKIVRGFPIGFMRSKTFHNAIVICDEAQNLKPEQAKLLLTRPGDNTKLIICGDEWQQDTKGMSGLTHALSKVETLDEVSVVRFTAEDCVRSELVKNVIKAYIASG